MQNHVFPAVNSGAARAYSSGANDQQHADEHQQADGCSQRTACSISSVRPLAGQVLRRENKSRSAL